MSATPQLPEDTLLFALLLSFKGYSVHIFVNRIENPVTFSRSIISFVQVLELETGPKIFR